MSEGIRVNFSQKEADAAPRDVEPLPSGKYLCTVTGVELRFSTSEKNEGKPYYAVEFTVVDDLASGAYLDRKCWSNVMLFEGALYSCVQILKTQNIDVNQGTFDVPPADEWLGWQMVVAGTRKGETKDKTDPSKTYGPKFEPRSYFHKDTWKASSVVGKGSKGAAKSAVTFLPESSS